MRRYLFLSLIVSLISYFVSPAVTYADWPMAGANPERTSYTSEEVRGNLNPVWYRPIEAYIAPYVQLIAAEGNIYLSTARGLYAFNAATGVQVFVFPTELPLGNAPTYDNGVLYVGGYDRKLYCLNAQTGQLIWSYDGAYAGYSTNPVVVNNLVYLGNRDGSLYAIYGNAHPNHGQLAWKFTTGGPLLFSPAFKDNTIYLVSRDMHAYAVNASDGTQKWISNKLPGANFQGWWPVIYTDSQSGQDYLVFSGSTTYETKVPIGGDTIVYKESKYVWPNFDQLPRGTLFGPLVGDHLMDASRAIDYYNIHPTHRSFFVLNITNGQEVTHAPFLFMGTHSGTRAAPVVGGDGLLYESMNFVTFDIPRGHLAGWRPGSNNVYLPTYQADVGGSGALAADEPINFTAGGNLIYFNQIDDRQAGAIDLITRQKYTYWLYDLDTKAPGYAVMTNGSTFEGNIARDYGMYGNPNGLYGYNGYNNPPVPYQGKVFMHRSNALIALGPSGTARNPLAPAIIVPATNATHNPTLSEVQTKLESEINLILNTGRLKPAWGISGAFGGCSVAGCTIGDEMVNYWHYPWETSQTLLRALPHLPTELAQRARTYIQNEFSTYPWYNYNYTGWVDGTTRDYFDLAPEITQQLANSNASMWCCMMFQGWAGPNWNWPPQMFYALWKYSTVFGNSKTLFDNAKSRLLPPPADSLLTELPYVNNAWISGLWGYLELEKLAGYPESADKRAVLNRLLTLRTATYTKDSPYDGNSYNYGRAINASRNFIFMVPELAQYLKSHIQNQVNENLVEINNQTVPYWFVSDFEATHGEAANQVWYDYGAIFQAKALIQGASLEELSKYLDVSATSVGDLFYIDNLISTLEAPSSSTVDYRTYLNFLSSFNLTANIFDFNNLIKIIFR